MIVFFSSIAEHDHHARILRGGHGRAQDPQRDEEDRVQEGEGARGQDERPVHVLQRPRRRQGKLGKNAINNVNCPDLSSLLIHAIIEILLNFRE